jgi:hypothetical protein
MMTRKTHVKEHYRRTGTVGPHHERTIKVRGHERALRADPRERLTSPGAIDPKFEEDLWLMMRDVDDEHRLDGINVRIMDGATDAEALRSAELILEANFVDPVHRERLMQRAREYLSRRPTKRELEEMRFSVDDRFSEIAAERSYWKGHEYATERAYEAIESYGYPPRPGLYDAVTKNLPDEDTYFIGQQVFSAVNNVEDALGNPRLRPSRQQLEKLASTSVEPGEYKKQALASMKKDKDLRRLIKSVPASRKDDPGFDKEYYG